MKTNSLFWMMDSRCSYTCLTDNVTRNTLANNKGSVNKPESIKQIIPKTLEELSEQVHNFDACLLKKNAKNTVFADGKCTSGLMIIGEAPGATEDEAGIPFCGLSGKLLDQILLAIGIKRPECYISNIIFWRPEGNRRPSDQEIGQCLPFVRQHIALVKPSVLLLLGNTASAALLDPKTSITNMRGKIFQYTNEYLTDCIPTIVSYHPSYLLRRPLSKRDAWKDFLFLKSTLETLNLNNVQK